jgi:hypothetical protein
VDIPDPSFRPGEVVNGAGGMGAACGSPT